MKNKIKNKIIAFKILFKKRENNITFKDIKTIEIEKAVKTIEIEKALKEENYKLKYINTLKNIVGILLVVIALSIIISNFIISVFKVVGNSMDPTLKNNEVVVVLKNSEIKQGDIIAFYSGNKILIKRVIGMSGDWINITDSGNVYINNTLLKEPYILNKNLGQTDLTYPYYVPQEEYFVMGDERKTSVDSRTSKIGTIKEEEIIGKVWFRAWPLIK